MTDSNFHAESSDLVKHMLRNVHGRVYAFIPSPRNLMTEISELACLSIAAFLKAGWIEWVAEAKVREKDRASVGESAIRHYLCLTAVGREIVGVRKGGCREDGCEALANSEEEPYSCQSCVDRAAALKRERIAAVAKERSGRDDVGSQRTTAVVGESSHDGRQLMTAATRLRVAAHRFMYKSHDGTYRNETNQWIDGAPSEEMLADFRANASNWKVEFAYAPYLDASGKPEQAAAPHAEAASAPAAPTRWRDEVQRLSEFATAAMHMSERDARNCLDDIAQRLADMLREDATPAAAGGAPVAAALIGEAGRLGTELWAALGANSLNPHERNSAVKKVDRLVFLAQVNQAGRAATHPNGFHHEQA